MVANISFGGRILWMCKEYNKVTVLPINHDVRFSGLQSVFLHSSALYNHAAYAVCPKVCKSIYAFILIYTFISVTLVVQLCTLYRFKFVLLEKFACIRCTIV